MPEALDADKLVGAIVDEACGRTPQLAAYAARLHQDAAVRLVDAVDHIAVCYDDPSPRQAGWTQTSVREWRREGRPPILERPFRGVVFRAERLSRIVQALGVETAVIDGEPAAPVRTLRLASSEPITVAFIERNAGDEPGTDRHASVRRIRRALIHQQTLHTRRRSFRSADHGLHFTERLIDAAVADLGASWAAQLFLNAELAYWATYCDAGMRQKHRLDRAGVGWRTVDHFAYAASRTHFRRTVALLGKLGFLLTRLVSTERARRPIVAAVLQPATSVLPSVVVEVDAARGEDLSDDAPLSSLTWHGEVGLAGALHGEPLLDGGPARVAIRCDIAALATLERADGYAFVAADAPAARYGASAAAGRPISPARVETLEREGYVTRHAAERLRLHGAQPASLLAIERAPGNGVAGAPELDLDALTLSDATEPDPTPFIRGKPMRMRRRRR